MAVGGGRTHYERPPVRRAIFTVYVKPLPYDIALINKLCEVWSTDYPGVRQTPPVPRSRNSYSPLPQTDPFDTPWPMPRIELVNSSLSRTIAFQFDHVSLTWRFDADTPNDQYPSYEVLAEELITKLGDFVRIVDDVSDATVEVQGCQCYYTNSLEDIGAERWLIGYLTGDWSGIEARDKQLDDAVYLGFQLHWNEEKDGLKRDVGVHVDEGKTQRPELDINSVAAHADPSSSATTDDPCTMARSLLDSAHEIENRTFEDCFSEGMKTRWKAQP